MPVHTKKEKAKVKKQIKSQVKKSPTKKRKARGK